MKKHCLCLVLYYLNWERLFGLTDGANNVFKLFAFRFEFFFPSFIDYFITLKLKIQKEKTD